MPLGSSASATVLATSTASMTGTPYVSVSVSSNMMTASETVVDESVLQDLLYSVENGMNGRDGRGSCILKGRT